MAYRGENASIPVDITNAAMRLPASVQYQIVSTNGQVPDYIVQNATLGVLEWDLEPGSEMELDIQIDWDLVDLQLEVGQVTCNLNTTQLSVVGPAVKRIFSRRGR